MKADITIDQVLTFGVEEEFLLADATTRYATPRAAEVLEKARVQLGEHAEHEFYATQVELTTVPCMTAEGLRATLARGRRIGAAAAAANGCLLVASASAVLTRHPLPVTPKARYKSLARRYRPAVDRVRGEPSGCHVHLGTLQRGEALLLGNHLRPWLPVLQALCVNSPFAAGEDRRCASWRYVDCQAWPTVEPAPALDEAAYEAMARDLTEHGPLADRKMIYWYSRPSERYPTLEVRIADANPDLDVVLLYAVLLRGLATTLLAEARHGHPWPEVEQSLLKESHRRVAARGLDGQTVDPTTGAQAPASAVLDTLIRRSRPGLAAADDEELAHRLLRRFQERGTTAARQNAVYRTRGALSDVVDWLAVR
ncbi:MAG: YbdK family carboxylate-amine ligase [Catenulispora sp.]